MPAVPPMVEVALIPIGVLLSLAEESWIPVIFAGLIPILGALAVLWLIIRAVRDTDEETDEQQ
jgi:hypothetical protein